MPGDRGWFERPPELYAPYAGHVRPGVVLLTDGSVMGMLHLRGAPFELEGNGVRNARARRLNALLRFLADDNLIACTHLVHRPDDEPGRRLAYASRFAADFMAAYQRTALDGRLWRNDWFLSLIVRPRVVAARKARQIVTDWWRPALAIDADSLRQLEDALYAAEVTLADYGARRLGQREAFGWTYSEIGEALFQILTAAARSVPETCGSLGAAIYQAPAVVRRRHVALNLDGSPRVGAMLGFREYPNRTRPGMLNTLLSAPYPLVLSQGFHFQARASAEFAFALKHDQMEKLGDRARSQIKALIDAMDDVASNKVGTGVHHLTLAVYAEDAPKLDRAVGDAQKRLADFGGSIIVREWRGLESAYWSQLPGAAGWRIRKGKISTRNAADLASFDGYPAGQPSGHWGAAILRFRTLAGTPYDFVPHVEDVGHTLLTGRSGSGKTTLLGTVALALEPAMGRDGVRVIIDKDGSNRLTVECSGGRYITLRRNRPSGLAPLRGFAGTPVDRSVLLSLFVGLIEMDGLGRIEPGEHRRIARGIDRQFRMPPEKRTLGGVREFMGYATNGAGDRFEKWCEGGSMGWLLANDEHLVAFGGASGGFYGFDFTELLPKEEGLADDGAVRAAAAVIIHQLRGIMDGRRIAAFCDEARFYMEPLAGVLEDMSLTGRKKELMLWLAAQQPEHFTEHPVGRSLVAQCRTKIAFPDPSADEASYRDGLKFSQPAVDMLRGDLVAKERCFLLWREGQPAWCAFDLSGMREMLNVVSAREDALRTMERVKADAPADVYGEFMRRRAVAQAA